MKHLLSLAVLAAAVVVLGGSRAMAEEAEAKEIKGSAACNACCFGADGCGAALKVGETVYALKPSPKADEATKKLIASFVGAGDAAEVTVKGVIKGKVVLADSVVKSAAAKTD